MSVVTQARKAANATKDDMSEAYHQSWFPVALASEVPTGSVVGRDFLGTRVVIYRKPAGQ